MKKLLISLFAGVAALNAAAVTPLWMRYASISPDGKEIAFAYKGDLYKVNSAGGDAVRLTSNESMETAPVWSNDGKQIAFASNRYGNYDVFVMPSNGGAAKRLTFNSANEMPSAFTADDKAVLFSAALFDPAESVLAPEGVLSELYSINIADGNIKQLLATPAELVSLTNDGKKFVYQDAKGFENQWRKHHTSSVTRDIWEYDCITKKHTNLTNIGGEDRNPVYSSDEKSFFFLSERNGQSMNVYQASLANPKDLKAVTDFKKHPVRFLSISNNDLLCYTYDGEIYTQKVGAKPVKVRVNIVNDEENTPATLYMASGISSAAVSPDGKQVAFVIRGEVFVTSADYATTKRITTTETGEAGVDFGKDNRSLVYSAERGGNWEIYRAKISRTDDLNFPNATIIDEERLTPNDGKDRTNPQLSPDGKKLAFIENEMKLMVMDLESKKITQVTDGSMWYYDNFNYSWSPDGKWFALEFIGNGHAPYSDVAIVKADGSQKPVNITNSGYFNADPKWVLGGNAIMFVTDRYGMRSHASWGSLNDIMFAFVNKDAYDKYRLNKEDYELLKELEKEQAKAKKDDEKKSDKKDKKDNKDGSDEESANKDITVELEDIQDRIVRVTGYSSLISDAVVDKDGENLLYLSSTGEGFDLWKIDLRERDNKLTKKLGSSPAFMMLDDKGDNLFIVSGSSIQKMGVVGEKLEKVSFRAKMEVDLAKEREYMYNHVCRQEERLFYRADMHGVNWKEMTKAYRKFLPHINNNEDFAELLSELLGELNVSHTGGRYRSTAGGDATANLGLLYDWSYSGKGLKVSEIIEKGPFDRSTTKVKAGDIIEKINGQEISTMTDFFRLMNNLRGQKTLVSFYNAADGSRWDEVVKPISNGAFGSLLYNRWVKGRAEDVKKWSNGRLGYVHIESMNDESFRTIYADILGKYNKCEGIVIDTRFNGGGRLHEDIEVLFSGEKYLTQEFKGRETCDMPSRRWNKPSIMVQCEANYSNAHGTPWVYKYKGLGKLVGAPVPGTMTSVSWETLQDNSLIFGIPVIGYKTAEGNYLENSQLEPDIYVLNSPEEVVKGEDAQLRAAVNELLKEIDSKK